METVDTVSPFSLTGFGQAKVNTFLDLAQHSYALGDEINAVVLFKPQDELIGGQEQARASFSLL